jgi:hypothetical protein
MSTSNGGERTSLLHGGREVSEDGNRSRGGYGSLDGNGKRMRKGEESAVDGLSGSEESSLEEGSVDGYTCDGEDECDDSGERLEGEDNPLWEGNKEIKQRLGLLFPAVALGVSFPIPLLRPASGWVWASCLDVGLMEWVCRSRQDERRPSRR